MLSKDKVIAIYCMIDDILKGVQHPEDIRRRVSDSEIITTAIVSAMFFKGHHATAIGFMRDHGYISKMIDCSRFSRRLHKVGELLSQLLLKFGSYLQDVCCEMSYILDSFPVAVCDNIRIQRCKLLKGKKWRGYTASMRRYFYGIKVQLLVTKSGIPVQFCFVPGNQADVKALNRIVNGLPAESSIFADSAYTDYRMEDQLKSELSILLKSQRKGNSKRPDTKEQEWEKKTMRKRVETSISDIKKMFPRTIHAVTFNGFLLKVLLFVFANQIYRFIN